MARPWTKLPPGARAVAFLAPFDDEDLGIAFVRQRGHAVQRAQVDDADHLLAQIQDAAHEGRQAGWPGDGAADIDDFAYLLDFDGKRPQCKPAPIIIDKLYIGVS